MQRDERAYDGQILAAALRLESRGGRPGKLPRARAARSISTSYYALFHFLTEEAGKLVFGSGGASLRRRRIFARAFGHKGIRLAFIKIEGKAIDKSIVDFLRGDAVGVDDQAPHFAREMARTFLLAQAKREAADYDLNMPLGRDDARTLRRRVSQAIAEWRMATGQADRDFKRAICMLMLLNGQLRKGD
ncbi:hypothetical protein ACFW16_03270 [Inquilinus sp. NPDC058860]|uniref:hypothetical protein n=1 Tax=Inquilinus sp. NPDC058860 TaxID=3346652 RepID=UPI00368DE5BC